MYAKCKVFNQECFNCRCSPVKYIYKFIRCMLLVTFIFLSLVKVELEFTLRSELTQMLGPNIPDQFLGQYDLGSVSIWHQMNYFRVGLTQKCVRPSVGLGSGWTVTQVVRLFKCRKKRNNVTISHNFQCWSIQSVLVIVLICGGFSDAE